jgi:hypothetical protein
VPQKDIWSAPVVTAIKSHQDYIGSNHGIKEANFCGLFIPLGFDVRIVDPLLLAELGAFGALRGAHAHQSHSIHIRSIFDPFDRRAKAQALLGLLKDFDQQLVSYVMGG